jgi:hypothetical protein
MKHFKMENIKEWEMIGAGEAREFQQNGNVTTVKIEFIADGPCAIFAQTRTQAAEETNTLVAYVEGGKFEVELRTDEDFAIWPQVVEGVTVHFKTRRRSQIVKPSADKVFTEVAPKRRQNDSMYQMQQMMNLNNSVRDAHYAKMFKEQEQRFAKQLAKYDANGDGVLDDAEKAARKSDKEAKAKADADAEAKTKAEAEAKAKAEAEANET